MSIPIEEMKKHPWPQPNFPIGEEVLDRTTPDDPRGIPDDNGIFLIPRPGYTYSGKTWPLDYTSSCFIPQNRVQCIPLNGIPHGACAIRGLRNSGKAVMGVTGGESAWFFRLDENGKMESRLLDSGVSAMALTDNAILLADGRIISIDGDGTLLGTLPAAVASATANDKFFGGFLSDGSLFLAGDEIKVKTMPDKRFSPAAAVTAAGLYGALEDGTIFHWNGTDYRELNCRMPSFAGRRVYNRVSTLLPSEDGNSLWGGTSEDGILFECNLKQERVRSFGKPLSGCGILALTWVEGNLLGLGGQGCCHVFRRDMKTAELTDEGMLNVAAPRSWCLYDAETVISDGRGGLWIGESDRISHLFHVTL